MNFQVINEMNMKDNQNLYLREGLDWTFIEFPSNVATMELLEMVSVSQTL